jgi:RNA polymerase sigma factor (sigma-70 family)
MRIDHGWRDAYPDNQSLPDRRIAMHLTDISHSDASRGNLRFASGHRDQVTMHFHFEQEIRPEVGFSEIVGQSPALRQVLRQVETVAITDSTVLLLGETGTGKKLLARAIHELSARRERAFVAVQDGLLAAARNLNSFEGRAQFSTWLTRIVLNAALMRRRKLHGRVIASAGQQNQDESGLSLAAKLADPRPDPEEAYAREERLRMVKKWLEALPASQRAALWFRDVEGMTTQEAADALHVPEGTLKSRLHRGRLEFSKRLRENFGSQRGDHGK